MNEMTDTDSIIEWLEDFGCNREPFTESHKDCQCRKAHKAAVEVTRLKEENERLRKEKDTALTLVNATCDGMALVEDSERRFKERADSLRSTISALLKVMEPFDNFIPATLGRDDDDIIDRTTFSNLQNYTITVGDLRALSEAFKRAKGTI